VSHHRELTGKRRVRGACRPTANGCARCREKPAPPALGEASPAAPASAVLLIARATIASARASGFWDSARPQVAAAVLPRQGLRAFADERQVRQVCRSRKVFRNQARVQQFGLRVALRALKGVGVPEHCAWRAGIRPKCGPDVCVRPKESSLIELLIDVLRMQLQESRFALHACALGNRNDLCGKTSKLLDRMRSACAG
jgi:hypothetical protein